MKAILIASFISLITGFGIAWNWQAQRWDADAARVDAEKSKELATAYAERGRMISEAEQKKEQIQNDFDAFRRTEDERNAAIDRGIQRVYVRATCPAVSGTKADPSRTPSGTAELDPAYRSTLSALRRGAEEQLRLLNICRAELGAR